MSSPRAWVLNLDAELELADPHKYRPSKRMLGMIKTMIPRLAIAPPGELVILARDGSRTDLDSRDYEGAAWCPTPQALAIMRDHGLRLPDVPDFEVIRKVNHREFALGLVPGLAVEAYLRSRQELTAAIASAPSTKRWVLKRPFGFSGRWRRIIEEPFTTGDEIWIEASWNEYGCGLLIEPWVDVLRDFVLHGDISKQGTIRFGTPVVQHCDKHGAWLNNRKATPDDLPPRDHSAFLDAGQITAKALIRAGYWGPFGIDAYRWRDSLGSSHFRALGEINARYTMGWWRAF